MGGQRGLDLTLAGVSLGRDTGERLRVLGLSKESDVSTIPAGAK